MSNFLDQQNEKLDGAQFNKTKLSSAFKKKRFYLDNAATRADLLGGNFFKTPFKSFWVYNTNNKSFVAEMFVNNEGDTGDSLPLRPNISIPFNYRQSGCALEWPAQPGVWVDIIFAFDSDITPGYLDISSSGTSVLSEGSSFTNVKVSVTNAGNSVLLASNSSRKKGIIQNVSGQPLWVGEPVALASADYQKICQRVESGERFPWLSIAALYGRIETTTTDSIAVMELM